jgi:ribonucleoside-diphosphate reductase alpha chain
MLRAKNGAYEIDYPKLAKTVKVAVRFLDNVIDVNQFPLPEIAEMTKKTRKIGLGVMGFADMLIQLGISYDSEDALHIASEVMSFINDKSENASVELAKERGGFPAFDGSINAAPDCPRLRNASCTTIAPTGTLSLIAGCSSGIEPLFALSYTRNILDGARLVEANSYFEEAAKKEGFLSEELMQQLASGVKLHDVAGVPNSVKRLFVTAHEITPEWHVRMQAAFQRSTHNAVSKTVNFPQQATREDIAKVYMMAYQDGLKGITIYRDRSRDAQVLTTGKKDEEAEGARRTPRKRAKTTTGVTERVTTGCGPLYITVNSDEQGICEVFSTLGKAGGCASAQLESTCRLISLALRAGVDVSSVVRQLRGIRCPSISWEDGKSVLSCADAIASVLEKYVGFNNKESAKLEAAPTNKGNGHDGDKAINIAGQCPDCGNLLTYQEGCFICPSCGYTKC